jgi:hypothetical protein
MANDGICVLTTGVGNIIEAKNIQYKNVRMEIVIFLIDDWVTQEMLNYKGKCDIGVQGARYEISCQPLPVRRIEKLPGAGHSNQ